MISDEFNKISHFDMKEGQIALSKRNVILAETVFNILNRNSSLENDIKTLVSNYSAESLDTLCKTINAENSTHLREHERKAIVKMILNQCKDINSFKKRLKDKNYALVYDIRALKESYENRNTIRANYSFATKFCHYSCYYLFKDDKSRDLYPIYDSVISDYVKKSIVYKNSKNRDLNDYKNYVNIIDEIIKDKEISRNGFDHLIWLVYR